MPTPPRPTSRSMTNRPASSPWKAAVVTCGGYPILASAGNHGVILVSVPLEDDEPTRDARQEQAAPSREASPSARYEIQGELGAGGVGLVLAALDKET